MIDYNKKWEKTYLYVRNNNFKGWDPYDGLTTDYKIFHKKYYIRLLFFYLNKFSPINLRPYLNVKKRSFTQPYMLIGLSHLYKGDYEKAEQFLDIIIKDSKVNEYGFHCWDGLDMPIQMINTFKSKGAPNVISTELAARFILLFIQKTERRKDELTNILFSVEKFFKKQMLVQYKGQSHFKYYHVTPENLFVFNSNANVCGFLAELDLFRGDTKNETLVIDILKSIIKYQNEDGYWNYHVNLKTATQKKQIDFHQGFILDDILRIMKVYGWEKEIEDSFKKGLNYYKINQFNNNGRSYYRVPKKWPVNIHNQSQGIITFTNAANAGFGEHYREFAETIFDWTVNNMLGKDGHFYYLKYPIFTNKIPYMRWSDANMLYAISHLINNKNN